MDFTFDDQQRELADVARDFFVAAGPADRVDAGPAARPAWDNAVASLGIQALGVPVELGGLGGAVELAAVLEESGRTLYPAPLLTSVGYANGLLSCAGGAAHDVLRQVVDTGRVVAVVDHPSVALEDGIVVGVASAVVDAEIADELLVLVGGSIVHIPGDAPRLSIEAQDGIDPSRRAARVRFDGVPATVLAVNADEAIGTARARAQGLAAVEAVGGIRATLDSVIEHVSTRRQFGVPVGSFQAVQHRAVDMLLDLDRAAAAAYHAAWCADADPASLAWAGPLALRAAAAGYGRVARDAIQLYGGIGFTWEHHAHRHFRRAVALATRFGAADQQLDQGFAAIKG